MPRKLSTANPRKPQDHPAKDNNQPDQDIVNLTQSTPSQPKDPPPEQAAKAVAMLKRKVTIRKVADATGLTPWKVWLLKKANGLAKTRDGSSDSGQPETRPPDASSLGDAQLRAYQRQLKRLKVPERAQVYEEIIRGKVDGRTAYARLKALQRVEELEGIVTARDRGQQPAAEPPRAFAFILPPGSDVRLTPPDVVVEAKSRQLPPAAEPGKSNADADLPDLVPDNKYYVRYGGSDDGGQEEEG